MPLWISSVPAVVFIWFTNFVVESKQFNLTILHTNDVHSRFEDINKYGGPCTDMSGAKCYGGVARRYTKINEIRKNNKNTILMDAGDQFQGTLWFYQYKGLAAAHFMNKMEYDVMALGNHEFDRGPETLAEFLKNVSFPVLSSNMDASDAPVMKGLTKKSVVLEVGGEKVGIVGYTTTETATISQPGKVRFNDEATAVQKEVDNLTSQGINKIIALGHSGFRVDIYLASTIRDVDIIVGGHTNTFLYTGAHPSNDKPAGVYPTVIRQASGAEVLVVQDYAFGKYLGHLQVVFDDAGNITSWSGNPILLDKDTTQDEGVLEDLKLRVAPVRSLVNQTIGRTHVLLDGQRLSCRLKECNLGNMLADALILRNIKHPDETTWANASISVVNGGSIRTPVPQGPITVGDMLTVWPFQNTIDIIEIKGQHLRLLLEHSVAGYDVVLSKGKFLQVSGLIVKYDLSQSDGSRVVDVQARCSKCAIPEFRPLEDAEVYQVVINSYLVNGGDGYDMIKTYAIKHHIIGDLDSDIAVEYVSQYSPIYAGLEGRIQFVNKSSLFPCPTMPSLSTWYDASTSSINATNVTMSNTTNTTSEPDTTVIIKQTCPPDRNGLRVTSSAQNARMNGQRAVVIFTNVCLFIISVIL